jgi:hypothetical protein
LKAALVTRSRGRRFRLAEGGPRGIGCALGGALDLLRHGQSFRRQFLCRPRLASCSIERIKLGTAGDRLHRALFDAKHDRPIGERGKHGVR